MFDAAKMRPFQSGDLFLGVNDSGRELGVRTDRHAVTVAGARSGKGACVIIPNLLRWPHNALVIDPKGENAQKTWEHRQAIGSSVYVLDPFETADVPDELRASFNPLSAIDPESLTASADLEVIADGLVKRSDPKHAQWDDGAVTVLAGIMAFVIAEAPEEHRTLKAVRDILIQDRDDIYADAQQMKQCEAFDGIAQEAGNIIMKSIDNEKGMEADFVTAAQRHIKWINLRAMRNVLEKSTFDLAELKHGKASVFVVLPPEYLETHAAFMRLFVRSAINVMAKGGSGRGEKCLFILDEFFSLGKMDTISKSAGLMPSYGVHLWPILQDLGQLIGMYGNEGSQTFFGNSDLHQFFGNTDKFTLDFMSQMTGEVGIKEIGAAPNAPASAQGQSLVSAATAHSKDGMIRGTGAVFGALSSGLGQLSAAVDNAEYQNEMNKFQQRMATVGRPRLSSEQIARLVQCKNDVVADNMFCITHGSDKILVKPAPYFRKIETPLEPAPQTSVEQMQKGRRVIFKVIAIFLILPAFVLAINIEKTPPQDQGGEIALAFVAIAIGAFFGWMAREKK